MKHFETYGEALEYSLTVPWKTKTCSVGTQCWCRIITPKQKITYGEYRDEITITGDGSVTKPQARHIVKMQNERCA